MVAVVIACLLVMVASVTYSGVAAWHSWREQTRELARIRTQQQMAEWQIQAFGRAAQAQMRRVANEAHNSASDLR